MNPRFLEALLNRPHRVMGRRLRPFSLWHYINLDFAESPIVGHPGSDDLYTLALAALICSSVPTADLRRIYPPQGAVARRLWMLRWVYPFRRHEKREQARFAVYQADFASGPRLWEKDGGGKVKSPWPLAAVARLMRFGGLSRFEAWTMPFGEAMWLQAALAEAGGGDPGIVSDAEFTAMRKAGWNV